MPTAHLICGYIGSGKTTFARELEEERRAVRFTHDEWMVRYYGRNPPADKVAEYSAHISKMIWEDALMALSFGRDVVLDFGFWRRADRDEARSKLIGHDSQMYLVVCDEETAWARVDARNKNPGDEDFLIERAAFDNLKQKVDRFTEDEDFVIVHSDG